MQQSTGLLDDGIFIWQESLHIFNSSLKEHIQIFQAMTSNFHHQSVTVIQAINQ